MSHFGGPDPSKGRLQEVVHPHPHGAPASLGRSRQNPYPGLRRGLDLPFGLVSATLDPGALHRLATNVCLAGGGDGDAVYWSAEVIGDARAGRLLANRLVDAIGAAGTVAPFREGRITLHDEGVRQIYEM